MSGQPTLKPGIYFIGFRLRNVGIRYQGVLTATIAGTVIDPEVRVQESIFSEDLEGWTRNDSRESDPWYKCRRGYDQLDPSRHGRESRRIRPIVPQCLLRPR